jgi:cytochrome c peroxidase
MTLFLCGGLPVVVAAEDPFIQARRIFSPLPDVLTASDIPLSPARIALGRKLFFDKRLSVDGKVSCETCHLPGLHATDGRNRSVGVDDRLNLRNAPTLLNAALQFGMHWDGSRQSVEDQATQSLIGPSSFGNPDYPTVIKKLKDLGYEAGFKHAFPGESDPIQPSNWGIAIGSFERTLVSRSPFDAYLKGSVAALNEEAQSGLQLFMETGCANCHDGLLIGGQRYAKFGIFADTASNPEDEGRFKVTQQPGDRMVFKVPPLRNVAMTPPYFHDGSVDDLNEAIRIMAKVQLNQALSPVQIQSIRAFLESLTGPIPPQFSAAD